MYVCLCVWYGVYVGVAHVCGGAVCMCVCGICMCVWRGMCGYVYVCEVQCANVCVARVYMCVIGVDVCVCLLTGMLQVHSYPAW